MLTASCFRDETLFALDGLVRVCVYNDRYMEKWNFIYMKLILSSIVCKLHHQAHTTFNIFAFPSKNFSLRKVKYESKKNIGIPGDILLRMFTSHTS